MENSPYSPLHPEWAMSYDSLENAPDVELAETDDSKDDDPGPPFSWLEYCSFFAIGMSMMWTWWVRLLQHFSLSNFCPGR